VPTPIAILSIALRPWLSVEVVKPTSSAFGENQLSTEKTRAMAALPSPT